MQHTKKAVSPIIATVLLIAIVIILAIIIFIWAQAFLQETTIKNDRNVEQSCSQTQYNYELTQNDQTNCQNQPGGPASLSIHNIGNIPIYGAVIKSHNQQQGTTTIITETTFPNTLSIGQTTTICLQTTLTTQNTYTIIPKLLAQQESNTIAYTCPEQDGTTISYTQL